jgi:hypothetical protein
VADLPADVVHRVASLVGLRDPLTPGIRQRLIGRASVEAVPVLWERGSDRRIRQARVGDPAGGDP